MNDRFKFRFWYFNYIEKKWKQEICVNLMSIDGSGLPFDNTEGGAYTEYDTEYITEQCTGLKDKNGKLIFEGDIVRRYVGLGKHGSQKTEDIDVVKWHTNGYVLENYCDYFADTDDFEVIGNIHENPDLLENKDDI